MYQDMEEQLNIITKNLVQELKANKAIDDSGRATNFAEFNRILNKKIDECNALLATTERDGVTVDRYGANLAFTRIEYLREILARGDINPNTVEESNQEKALSENQTPSAFKLGMKKMMEKIKSKMTRANSNTNNINR